MPGTKGATHRPHTICGIASWLAQIKRQRGVNNDGNIWMVHDGNVCSDFFDDGHRVTGIRKTGKGNPGHAAHVGTYI